MDSAFQQLPDNTSNVNNKKWVVKQKSKYADIEAVIPQMQTVVKKLRERNDTDLLPDPPNRRPSGLFFSNAEEAASANRLRYWEPPANDNSIPTTQVEIEAWVRRLVDAMLNDQGCLKTNSEQESRSHVNRWSAGAQFYRRRAIEAVAWRLLVSFSVVTYNDRPSTDILQQLAKDVHEIGWREAIAEPKLRSDIYYSMDFTFQQRMHMVERILQVSQLAVHNRFFH